MAGTLLVSRAMVSLPLSKAERSLECFKIDAAGLHSLEGGRVRRSSES